MSTVSPEIRLHRIFSVAAVLHAGLLLASVSYAMSSDGWPLRLWVALTTLWFFWPFILALHVGASVRSAYAAVAISAAVVALPMHAYQRFLAPQVLLPDEVSSLSPYYLGPFMVGYVRGWREAKQRAGMQRIVLESYGLGGRYTPAAPPFTDEALQRYGIDINPIAQCGVTPFIVGHARGYNTAAVAEIKRRYGSAVITSAEQEEAVRQQRYTAMKDTGHAQAETDAREGRLAYLLYQPRRGGEEEYRDLFRENFQIELRRVAESYGELEEARQAYVNGYNEAASDEIARRFGERARQDLWAVDYRPVEEFRRAVAAANRTP